MQQNPPTSISSAELHIWKSEPEIGRWPDAQRLSGAERERAAAMPRGNVRDRWVAARWALRGVLARYVEQDPAEIALSAGERGKPMLAAPETSLRFNLSHSGGLAVVAISSELEVGVDVERIRPRRNLMSLARRALAPEQAGEVEAAPPEARPAAFHTAWTRREAVAKCLGTGLAAPLPDSPVAVCNVDLGEPGYAAAVAVAAEAVPVPRHFTIEPD